MALPLLMSACILDLSGLSEPAPTGGSGGAGGATGEGGEGAGSVTTTAGPSCSPLSCGACEAPCPADGCPPTVIANGVDVAATPLGVAALPGALYWVNEATGTIVRLLDDGSPPAPIASGADQPRTIAAGADLVVWSAKDGVWACAPDDCEATKRQLAPSMAPHSVREVAYDGQIVFWTDRGTTQDALDGQVLRCAPSECAPTAIAVMQWAPTGLTLLDDTLLWTSQAGAFQDGRILKASKPAMAGEELSAGRLQPTGIAADDLRVYWSEYNSMGRVYGCPHTTGYCNTPVDVAPALGPLSYPRDVALAGGRVYFSTTEGDGALRSCPTPGCGAAETPKVHAAGRPGLHRMAVGATCLFFTDETNGGSVVKVAR